MSEGIGELIDNKYRVEALLGKGGMGVVYKATHIIMERTVAIKMLHKHLLENVTESELLERFKIEAKAQASIEHPNAVTIHDYGIHEGSPYLVMQYIEGKTLKELLAEEPNLERARMLPFFLQVADAIHQAHSLGIVHRDLKPDNIIVTKQLDGTERAFVTDFGIAKFLQSESKEYKKEDTDVTSVQNIVGTPKYISPEQVTRKAIDARSDIYSLGVILYEVCVGRLPFESDTSISLLMEHMAKAPPAPKEIAPEKKIPLALEKVILKSLSKDPFERQQSIPELIQELIDAVPAECGSTSGIDAAELSGQKRAVAIKISVALGILASIAAIPIFYKYQSLTEKNLELLETAKEASTMMEKVEKAQADNWPLVRASLDDSVEKARSISSIATEVAQFNQRISTLSSPSRLELFERQRDKKLKDLLSLTSAYTREISALSRLTNSKSLNEQISRYMEETANSVVPNKMKLATATVSQLRLLEEGSTLDEETLILESIRASDPEALKSYKGNFTDFCSSCEEGT